MSTPHGQGGGGRTSRPPASVAAANIDDRSTASPMQQAHATARSDPSTAVNQTQDPFTNRRLTGQAHTARTARQNMSSIVGGNPPPSAPSAMRKRGPGSVANAFGQLEAERAAKRPANASTRSDLMSGDAAFTHGGMIVRNANEGPASSEGERLDSLSPGEVEVDAAGNSIEPAHFKSEQASVEMTRPLASENYKNAASTRPTVTDGPWARPRSESTDRSAHGGYRQIQGGFNPGEYGVRCGACRRSRLHRTRDCHVPSKDGTVPICSFHDCSVLHPHGPQSHPLDGHTDYDPVARVKVPLYCITVLKYKQAVRDNHAAKIRSMLGPLFKNLVIDRRRKPCCRVVSKELCPINLTIQYSVEFCQGKMPRELEGIWPYTIRDATDPAICAKLQHFDELGWKGMPEGELEFKSWEEIKFEYGKGIIPPQIRSKHMPRHQTSMAMPTAAGLGDTEAHLHASGADFEPQNVHEDGDGHGSLVQEGAVQSQDPAKMDVIIQMLGTLTENVDANSKQLAANSEQLASLSEQVAALSTLTEKVDVNSEQLAALSEQVAVLSPLPEKVDGLFEKKKEVLYRILDSLP